MNKTPCLLSRFSIALAAASLVLGAGSPALAQDKAKAPTKAEAKADAKKTDERDRKVHVDNDRILASEVRYKPGASSGMLERNHRVSRGLSEGTLEKTFPDGRKETINWKVGEVRYNPKETYSQKNIGKTDVVLYTVSIKEPKK